MKTFLIYTAVFLAALIGQNASAQKGWSLHAKALPQFSAMQNEEDNDLEEYDRQTTIHEAFGIGAGYNFTRRAGLELGVLYSLQGQKYTLDGEELKQKMNYIKLPLTFNYTFNPNDKVLVIGKLGPQVSILSASKLKDADGKTLIGNTKAFFNDVTFGGVAGISTQFRLGKQWHFTTGLRYDIDFTNAENKNHPDYTTGRKKTQNMTGGVELGLKYTFN